MADLPVAKLTGSAAYAVDHQLLVPMPASAIRRSCGMCAGIGRMARCGCGGCFGAWPVGCGRCGLPGFGRGPGGAGGRGGSAVRLGQLVRHGRDRVGGRVPARRFWRRELPPLQAVLQAVTGLDLIVVDGYVDLDPAGPPDQGARVHVEFGGPVIGVAKNFFRGASHAVPVCRCAGAGRPGRAGSSGVCTRIFTRRVTRRPGMIHRSRDSPVRRSR
jgi:hypothetical protein